MHKHPTHFTVRVLVGPIALVAPLVLACGAGDRSEDTVGPGVGDGAGDSDTGAPGGDDGDGDDGGAKFDIGSGGTGGAGDDTIGCDKVDFLFVVDNSGSMQDEQQNLIGSFPGFINAITSTVAMDYHVMAVSTDDNTNTGLSSSCTNGVCNCTPAPVCCHNSCGFGGVSCNGFDCNNLPTDQCDYEWGVGKQFNEQGMACNLEGNRRWFTDTQPAVEQTFSCVATVGTYGSGAEKPMLAMGWAVSDTHNDAGGCNEGFLRDDAILVVTIITDEEDDADVDENGGSPGDPPDWAQSLIDAKLGNGDAVVVLALVGDSDAPGGQCPAAGMPGAGDVGAEASPRLRAFAESFTYGHWGSICAPDYTPFFEEAISIIDTSCEEFVPPG